MKKDNWQLIFIKIVAVFNLVVATIFSIILLPMLNSVTSLYADFGATNNLAFLTELLLNGGGIVLIIIILGFSFIYLLLIFLKQRIVNEHIRIFFLVAMLLVLICFGFISILAFGIYYPIYQLSSTI